MRALMTLVAFASYPPVLVLGLFGLIQCWRIRRRDFFWATVIMLVTTTLLHGIVWGGKRYRTVTVDPELMVLAAWQASLLLTRWWQEPRPSAITTAVR